MLSYWNYFQWNGKPLEDKLESGMIKEWFWQLREQGDNLVGFQAICFFGAELLFLSFIHVDTCTLSSFTFINFVNIHSFMDLNALHFSPSIFRLVDIQVVIFKFLFFKIKAIINVMCLPYYTSKSLSQSGAAGLWGEPTFNLIECQLALHCGHNNMDSHQSCMSVTVFWGLFFWLLHFLPFDGLQFLLIHPITYNFEYF